MSSKEEENNNDDDSKRPRHPGGPLQWSGAAADSWNEALGSSLAVISQLYLPTNRTVLRRYRFQRMTNELATINELAQKIGVRSSTSEIAPEFL